MNCYDCSLAGERAVAVGVCALCGMAVCREHSVLQHLPQIKPSGGGIGGPMVRAPHDQRRLVCTECAEHSWQGERGVTLGAPLPTQETADP